MSEQDDLSEIDFLNQLVSSGIKLAEGLEDTDSRFAKAGYEVLWQIEARLASLHPAASLEGQVARRGAVSAALKAEDSERAKELVARYLRDEDVDEQLRSELTALLEETG
jgi:cobalamin biosynthesis protein CbiD